MFLRSINNLINSLLNSDIHNLIAIIGQDDVNEILADIVHIAFDGSKQHAPATLVISLFHMWFKIRNGALHNFSTLQNER